MAMPCTGFPCLLLPQNLNSCLLPRASHVLLAGSLRPGHFGTGGIGLLLQDIHLVVKRADRRCTPLPFLGDEDVLPLRPSVLVNGLAGDRQQDAGATVSVETPGDLSC